MLTDDDLNRVAARVREELLRDGKLRVDVDFLSTVIGEKLTPVVAGALVVLQAKRDSDQRAERYHAALERIARECGAVPDEASGVLAASIARAALKGEE